MLPMPLHVCFDPFLPADLFQLMREVFQLPSGTNNAPQHIRLRARMSEAISCLPGTEAHAPNNFRDYCGSRVCVSMHRAHYVQTQSQSSYVVESSVTASVAAIPGSLGASHHSIATAPC